MYVDNTFEAQNPVLLVTSDREIYDNQHSSCHKLNYNGTSLL